MSAYSVWAVGDSSRLAWWVVLEICQSMPRYTYIQDGYQSRTVGLWGTVLWEPRTRDKSLLSQDSSVPAKCASKHNVGITQLQMLWLKSTMKNIHTRKMIPSILLCFFHKGFRCLSLVASCIYMNSSEVNCQMSLSKSDWYIRNTKDECFFEKSKKT